MIKVKDLAAALLVMDFKGVTCNISSQLFTGEFEVNRVWVKNNIEILKSRLVMDTNIGALTLNLDSPINKLDDLCKLGYIISVENIDNKPVENCMIEISIINPLNRNV